MPASASWLVCAALALLMQAGFALVNTGLCRAKNASQVASANLIIFLCALLAFWVCGFALMSGPAGAGGHGFFFSPSEKDHHSAPLFVIGALLVGVAAVIPAGALAERWSLRNIVLYGFFAGALPVAIYGRWVWSGGWLARLGQSLDLGHGAVDLAGASVVHMAGGVTALIGAIVLGPRAGKYARDGRPKPIPGHNLVFVVAGTMVLFAGWLGFNAAWASLNASVDLAVVILNTVLAGAAGGLAAYVTTVRQFGKPDPSMLCNGILAGLAAISGASGFVNSFAAVVIGVVAGVVVVHAVLMFEVRFKIDDPVGAISVHGIGGAWGMVALGLFANGRYGAGWHGVHLLIKGAASQRVPEGQIYLQLLGEGWNDAGVTGALGKMFGAATSDWGQLAAQCLAVLAGLIFIGLAAFAWFKLANLMAPMRVRRDFEIAGLNLPETGAECYPDFHLTDKSQTGF